MHPNKKASRDEAEALLEVDWLNLVQTSITRDEDHPEDGDDEAEKQRRKAERQGSTFPPPAKAMPKSKAKIKLKSSAKKRPWAMGQRGYAKGAAESIERKPVHQSSGSNEPPPAKAMPVARSIGSSEPPPSSPSSICLIQHTYGQTAAVKGGLISEGIFNLNPT